MFVARPSHCCSPVSNKLQFCRFLAVPWRAFFQNLKEQASNIKEKPLDDDINRYADEEFHYVPMGESDIPNQATVSFLSRTLKQEKLISIKTISKFGFRTHDKNYLLGPIAVFPRTVLSWRVPTPDHITPESLELFFMLQPKLDVLVIGVGDRKDIDAVRKRILPTLQRERIGYEILTTEDAISTFNFLNGMDHRYVAAALFPPADIKITSKDMARTTYMQSGNAYQELSDPDRCFHILDGPSGIMTNVERIWGYTEESRHAMEVINALRDEKFKMRTERLEAKIEKDKNERSEAILAAAEGRRLEALRAEEEQGAELERKKLQQSDQQSIEQKKHLPKKDDDDK